MTKTTIRIEAVEQLKNVLESIQDYQADEISKADAIRMLTPTITSMRAKGYSLSKIAAMLSERGILIDDASLSSYLAQSRRKPSKSVARPKKIREQP